jgi:hypothetical protein
LLAVRSTERTESVECRDVDPRLVNGEFAVETEAFI